MKLPPRQVAILELMSDDNPMTVKGLRDSLKLLRRHEGNIRMNLRTLVERGMISRIEDSFIPGDKQDYAVSQFKITKRGNDGLHYFMYPEEEPKIVKKSERSLWDLGVYVPSKVKPVRLGADDFLQIKSVGLPT